MAGISDIITQVEAVVEAINGLTQHKERQDLRHAPSSILDGTFQIRIGDHIPVEVYGNESIRALAVQLFVDIGYELDFSQETKFKSIGTLRESVAKALENPSNWDNATTGIRLINYISASLEELDTDVESVEDHLIDTLTFDVEYKISW